MRDEMGKWQMRTVLDATAEGVFEPPIEGGHDDPCDVCGMPVEEGDAVSIEAPAEFMEKHINDDIRILKVYHKMCFETMYHIKLPEFKA